VFGRCWATGTNEGANVERNVAFFESHLTETQWTSQQKNYLSYGSWLLCAGRINEARAALLKARDAKPFSDSDASGRTVPKYVYLYRLQIETLLDVISHITPFNLTVFRPK
jgi:hypothetical protein